MPRFCSFLAPGTGPAPAVVARHDDEDDGDVGMPLPAWDDPDWGFDDEETQPEDGDFWFDSSDEEDG